MMLCTFEPENSSLMLVVDAPKWSLGHKTYREKTLLGINVNNCNILCFALRIASRSCFVFPSIFHGFPLRLHYKSLLYLLMNKHQHDPMMDFESFLSFAFSSVTSHQDSHTSWPRLMRKHFLIVIVTNKQHELELSLRSHHNNKTQISPFIFCGVK